MRAHEIAIDERTELARVLSGVRRACADSGVSEENARIILADVEATAADFASRGAELSSIGSHFQARREIERGGLRVIVRASFGRHRPSLLSRVLSFLWGNR